ncbi:MAG: site-specific integrase [Bacteroidota bacterium]
MDKFNEYLIIKGYSTASIKTIIRSTEYFFKWCEADNISDIAAVSHNDVVAYVKTCNAKGTGRKTVAHYIMHLKKYFDFLQEEGEVNDNPCSNIKIKGIKRKVLYEILSIQELENLYNSYSTEIKPNEEIKYMPPQEFNILSRKRNKIITGLLVYQGLRSEEVKRLEVTNLKLREGKIFIAGSRRTNERTLKLEPQQIFDLLDYINDTRKHFLQLTGQPTQQLFISKGSNYSNVMSYLNKQLHQLNSKVKDLKQIRTSVITHWLKLYNLRKVQVMAGHRYVSSTESYQANNLEDLKEDIRNYHPFN